MTVDVYKSGVFAGTLLALSPVSSTTGSLVSLPWNASILGGSPPSASGVEIRISGFASATATVEVGGIQWLQEFASNGSATVTDSGWIAPAVPARYWGTRPPQTRMRRHLHLAHIKSAAVDWNEAFLEVHAGANYDGYFQGGKLVIGAGETLPDLHGGDAYEDLGLILRPVDPSIKERAFSGASIGQRLTQWREIEAHFTGLTKSTALDVIADTIAAGGITTKMLWVFRPDNLADANAILWGELTDLKEIPNDLPAGYSWGVTVEESV